MPHAQTLQRRSGLSRSAVRGIASLSLILCMMGASPGANATTMPLFTDNVNVKSPYASKTVFVKCPVERIRDTNIVGIISESGRTKAIAVAKANDRVYSEYGIGYRLHHCTVTGGSSSF